MYKIKKNFSFFIPVIALTALLVVLAGCESQEKVKAEELKAIARRDLEEVWNQGKLDVIDEIFAADHIFHEPTVGEIRGSDGYKQFVTMFRTAFPDVKYTIEDQIAEGDKVVTRWSCTGTHKGELMGIPPTGLPGSTTGITIDRYVGGKIVEAWVSWDALGMWQRLGVIPPIGQGEE